MKKAILGFVVIGAIIASRPVARRMGRVRGRWEQMAAQCKQMAAQIGARGEAIGRT